MVNEIELTDVAGSGGGGKGGGGGGRTAQEDPNSLQSNATAEILELLGEGEIVGLADGAKSIFLNDTPLVAADGTANFQGVEWVQRFGLPDQEPIPAFANASAETPVQVKVTRSGGPVTRTIAEPDADALRITVHVPSLTFQDPSNGDMHGSRVEFVIQVCPNGGAWQTVVNGVIEGKTTSGYQRTYRFDLPPYGAPWGVRVERLTADSDKTNLQNELYWQSYTTVTYGKFAYPDCALIGLRIDAKQFGASIPTRTYDVMGRKIRVPTNYDPATRRYTGIWDGSWKIAWTDNPAWVFLDLLLEPRFGLGDFIAEDQVDRWSLYQIARYCDGVDANGFFVGVPDGEGGRMPRFTYNGVLQTKEDAYGVLQQIASCFRGLAYWSSGMVVPRADLPADPVKLVTPANVIDGVFSYSSTAIKARHTVALVSWNDPDDGFRPAIEVVEDREGLLRYGYRPIEVAAPGCARRMQARRFGQWILESEQNETETVSYKASWDHLDVMPGDVISVADPSYAGVRLGGRIAGHAGSTVTLDAVPELDAQHTYRLAVTQPDGSIIERPITGWSGADVTVSGTIGNPVPGAVFVITASHVKPRPFRVMGVAEDEPGVFSVTALFHDPGKYARVDEGTVPPGDLYQITDPRAGGIPSVTNLRVVESVYWVNGLPHARLTVSWTPPASVNVRGYLAQVLTPGGQWQTWPDIKTAGFDIEPAAEGQYVIRVYTESLDNHSSLPAEVRAVCTGKGAPPGPPTGLTATGGYRQVVLSWSNPTDSDLAAIEVWESATDQLIDAAKVAEIKGNAFVRGGLGGLVTRWYWVRARDLSGNVGQFNSNLGTPATTEQVSHDDVADAILDSPLLDALTEASLQSSLTTNGLADQQRGDRAYVKTQVTELLTADQALAQQITEVVAGLGDAVAAIQQEATARVDEDGALAQQIATVQTAVDGALATVQTQAQAIDGIQAQYTIKTQVLANGKPVVAGIGVMADVTTGSEVIVLADRFAVVNTVSGAQVAPFVVTDGKVSIPAAFITEVIAALLRSPDNKFVIDLANKYLSIEV
ncbi:MAG TPA: phage tail protein [Azospirillum sp.]|nr:phage tail protein [Azospirillum sp.]